MLKTALRALALFGLGAVALTTTPKTAHAWPDCFPCVFGEWCTNPQWVCNEFCSGTIAVGCGSGCGSGRYILWCYGPDM